MSRTLMRLTLALSLLTAGAQPTRAPDAAVTPIVTAPRRRNDFHCAHIDIPALARAWKAFRRAPLWSVFSINTTDPEDPWAAQYPHVSVRA